MRIVITLKCGNKLYADELEISDGHVTYDKNSCAYNINDDKTKSIAYIIPRENIGYIGLY